jgi:hypothetical protein
MAEDNTFFYNLGEGWKVIKSPFDEFTRGEDLGIMLKALGYLGYPTLTVGESESFSVEWHRPADISKHRTRFC